MRSFYVVWIGPNVWLQREDYVGFADAFHLYRSQEKAQLWGVDGLDCSCLMGERGLTCDF